MSRPETRTLDGKVLLTSSLHSMFAHWHKVVGTIAALRDATGIFAHHDVDESRKTLIMLQQVMLTELSAANTVEQAQPHTPAPCNRPTGTA